MVVGFPLRIFSLEKNNRNLVLCQDGGFSSDRTKPKGQIKLFLCCPPSCVHAILREPLPHTKPVLVQLGIDDIEVVLPLGAISRFLPMASNNLAVLAHSTLITLPEAGRFPPHLPHSLREAHPIHPRNAPRVIGEHGIVGGRVIPANEPESMGGFGDLSPMRSARKAPSCTHSIKTGPPFTLSDGRGRKAALESSISQSPTNPSRGVSAGFG